MPFCLQYQTVGAVAKALTHHSSWIQGESSARRGDIVASSSESRHSPNELLSFGALPLNSEPHPSQRTPRLHHGHEQPGYNRQRNRASSFEVCGYVSRSDPPA